MTLPLLLLTAQRKGFEFNSPIFTFFEVLAWSKKEGTQHVAREILEGRREDLFAAIYGLGGYKAKLAEAGNDPVGYLLKNLK